MSTPAKYKVGDKLRDNDPRMPNRVLTIIEITPLTVYAEDRMGSVRGYSVKRVHADGKPRKSGFSVEPQP